MECFEAALFSDTDGFVLGLQNINPFPQDSLCSA